MQVSVTITGAKDLKSKLKKLGPSLMLFQHAMGEIGKQGARYFQDVNFASQGGVVGYVWPRLSPKYSVWKAKHYPGRGPLVRTGAMQHAFDYSANSTSVHIQNLMPYAKYHDSTAPRTKMPYRPLTGVNEPIKNLIKDVIEKDIRNKLGSIKL